MKTPFTIRVEQVDMEAWVHAANLAGMSISEWARRGLNEYAGRNGRTEKADEAGNTKNVQRVAEVPAAERSTPPRQRAARTPREPKPAAEPVKQMQFTAPEPEQRNCKHDYGFKKCPFPNCENNKWKDEK
jgi:hypothetical protein